MQDTQILYQNSLAFAKACDAQDPLRSFREKFHFPKDADGNNYIYLCGNSLGLQPKNVQEFIQKELDHWAKIGVEGHFKADIP